MKKQACLIILDGWGIGDKTSSNAVYKAPTPFFDSCLNNYPHAKLKASGEEVGLPKGQMGNSEVGHLNIGAGRIVHQDLLRINRAISSNELGNNKALIDALSYAKKENKKVHLMGLVSDGGVHSHINHLKALGNIVKKFTRYTIHAFLDGRDCDPKKGKGFIKELSNFVATNNGEIASVMGRFYAMDRDNRWERIKVAYDALTKGIGTSTENLVEAIEKSYKKGITDEFLTPLIRSKENIISPDDVVICFNFRTDRCREIVTALTQKEFPEYQLFPLKIKLLTMTNYNEEFKNITVLFDKKTIVNPLGKVLEDAGKSQLRAAETEKYPHVTFFFSGGREEKFNNENRILIPSPKVATYDLAPKMSAKSLTNALVEALNKKKYDFVCLNFANPDMVGHTGNFKAIVEAVAYTDKCLKEVVTAGIENNYSFIIIADHGNAEVAINPNGSPNTNHTTNKVPVILIDPTVKKVKDGILADVAPTILKLLAIPKAKEMSGDCLF